QALTEPNDAVILQRPVYYPFSHAVEHNGRIISYNALLPVNDVYRIDFDDLERRAADPRAKLLILSNPHNPVSRVYTREELLHIGEICHRNHVTIFSDEIHSDFIFSGNRHIPIASLSPEIADITITALSPSKTFNLAGMRAACLVIPNKTLRRSMSLQFRNNCSALEPTFGLDAYIAAYEHGAEYVDQLIPYIEANAAYLDSYLKAHMPKIRLIPPQGTYLMWLDCRELSLSDRELDNFFTHKAGVALDKGYWFGAEGSGFMRMNIACPRAMLQEALQRIQKQYDQL
ncbi:MAG: MalY/PatB family protein, partial [Butyricicoccaceae bacterium]